MGDSEAPKRELSRYTVRPGTLGSTLYSSLSRESAVLNVLLVVLLIVFIISLLVTPCLLAMVYVYRAFGATDRKPS
jgi:hypothetical protein